MWAIVRVLVCAGYLSDMVYWDSQLNEVIINVITYTCAFTVFISQNVCCEKDQLKMIL